LHRIERPQFANARLYHIFHFLPPRDIGYGDASLSTHAVNLSGDLITPRSVGSDVIDADVVAIGSQAQCYGLANASAGPCDDYTLPLTGFSKK
jgi:hypothetical protein